jgi:hypothetical protein
MESQKDYALGALDCMVEVLYYNCKNRNYRIVQHLSSSTVKAIALWIVLYFSWLQLIQQLIL